MCKVNCHFFRRRFCNSAPNIFPGNVSAMEIIDALWIAKASLLEFHNFCYLSENDKGGVSESTGAGCASVTKQQRTTKPKTFILGSGAFHSPPVHFLPTNESDWSKFVFEKFYLKSPDEFYFKHESDWSKFFILKSPGRKNTQQFCHLKMTGLIMLMPTKSWPKATYQNKWRKKLARKFPSWFG